MYTRYCILRDEKGLKDADVSKETGITKSTFTDWKKGKSKPNADKVLLIAKVLGTTVEYLMTGEEPEKPEIPGFEPEHLELIELYSKLNKEQKSAILNMMRSFALSD